MANKGNQKPHAIMVCLHLQGHINPFVNLAIKLASKGFSITFAHFQHVHHQISTSQPNNPHDFFAGARASGFDIHYTTVSDGLPIDFDRSANLNFHLHNFLHKFPDRVDEFVGSIIQSHSSVDCRHFLIADTFSVWHSRIAGKYGLINVSFWTEPALVFSLYYHLKLLRENGHVPVNGRHETVNYLPGIPSINTRDFMSYLHDSELDLLHDLIFDAFEKVKSAHIILCNTVEELESEAISALQAEQGPFYSIGPLFPVYFSTAPVPRSLLQESDTSGWLNSRPNGSVLYVSFGSLAMTDKNVIGKIAGGLLKSGVDFIWALRPGIVESVAGDGLLPEGFEDSTRERGLIVPWCNQIQVLMNPAIGGFLTHCGWNSVLESVWYGVPMVCYPLFTDQITNRKLVVDDWKVGLNLCDGGCITEEEVAEKIRVLMSEKGSCELRTEIERVRKTVRMAVSKDGSSETNFDRFIEDVMDRINQ